MAATLAVGAFQIVHSLRRILVGTLPSARFGTRRVIRSSGAMGAGTGTWVPQDNAARFQNSPRVSPDSACAAFDAFRPDELGAVELFWVPWRDARDAGAGANEQIRTKHLRRQALPRLFIFGIFPQMRLTR